MAGRFVAEYVKQNSPYSKLSGFDFYNINPHINQLSHEIERSIDKVRLCRGDWFNKIFKLV